MTQTRVGSIVETIAGTAIGYGVAVVANVLVLPAFGYPVTFAEANGIAVIFTIISVIRGYVVRRLFNRIRRFHK